MLAPILKKVRKAVNAGLLKIISKMGISTISSYRNSMLFDIIGLGGDLVQECFPRANTLLKGLDYKDIEERIVKQHKEAYGLETKNRIFPLNLGGFYKYLDGGEYHDFGPTTVHAIHRLSISGKKEDYQIFKNHLESRDKKLLEIF